MYIGKLPHEPGKAMACIPQNIEPADSWITLKQVYKNYHSIRLASGIFEVRYRGAFLSVHINKRDVTLQTFHSVISTFTTVRTCRYLVTLEWLKVSASYDMAKSQ